MNEYRRNTCQQMKLTTQSIKSKDWISKKYSKKNSSIKVPSCIKICLKPQTTLLELLIGKKKEKTEKKET